MSRRRDDDARGTHNALAWLPEADSDFSRLVTAMCTGAPTLADRDRLEEMLRDPAARRAYRAVMRIHGELLWRHAHGGAPESGAPDPETGRTQPTRRGRPHGFHQPGGGSRAAFAGLGELVRGLLRDTVATLKKPAAASILIAAAILGGGLVVAGFTSLGPAQKPVVTEIVGRITGLHEARWARGGNAWGTWDAVGIGSRLELTAGFAEVSLLDGGRIILEGPTVLEVLAADRVSVERGLVAARYDKKARPGRVAEPDAVQLTIQTPAVVIEDLGTEFGVGVAADGTAEVHVFEGLVQLRPMVAAPDAVPPRLGPGDARQVERDGGMRPGSARFASRIVRVFPGREPPEPPPDWVAEEAVVVYADRFTGSGSPNGTTPAARGGVGDEAWHAVGTTWSLAGGLHHAAASKASGSSISLPFEPEAGCVYQIAVTVDVTAGGIAWGALGFLPRRNGLFYGDPLAGADARVGYAWMVQRHERDPRWGGNFAAAGPGITGKIEQIDNRFGRHRRMVRLDTRGSRWLAKFFVDDELVAWHVFDRPPPIRFVGLGAAPNAVVAFTDFRVEVWRPSSDEAKD